VETIEYKLSCSSEKHNNAPRPITLFTTDANLFATDMTSESHIHGLEQFWKRIYSSFQTSAVSSITIMIVETTSMMQVMKNLKSYENDDSSVNDYSMGTSSSFPNRLAVIQCVNDIRRRIGEMSRAQDFESTTPINLQLEIMDGNSIAFQTLLQSWVKESFAQTYASYESGVQGRLSFDLPETLDGTMCQLSLDLQYTVLPPSINSPATKELVEDMQRIYMLSPSCVEVVQTIPLSSVDSSLIYGVPMSARASLENDISRYNEMKVLARQLWVYLGRNDVALVLRARVDEEDDDVVGGRSEDQLFLLVCEQAVQKPTDAASSAMNIVPDKQGSESSSSCHGMLYRYATKSQLLREYLCICYEVHCFMHAICHSYSAFKQLSTGFGNEDQKEEVEEEKSMAGMNEQYFDYIEQSLDTLISTSVNPLLM